MPAPADPPQSLPPCTVLRQARPADLPELMRVEGLCFTTDRLTRRNFQYLLTRGRTVTLVEVAGEQVVGYILILFHAGTSLARIYSVAVDPAWHGLGVGTRLLRASEQVARDHGCASVRLEVRRDNLRAVEVYKKLGYREFGVFADYYEDHMAALRLEKRLAPAVGLGPPDGVRFVPYYAQTLDFTCGPAALMMAMKAQDPAVEMDRRLELRIWRESTTVFMTSGHGGCGPHGLALSAWHRGFDAEIFVNDERTPFVDSVRSAEKKEVMRLVHEDFLDEIGATGIRIHPRTLTIGDLAEAVADGAVPIVLISSYRIYRTKAPHWVVVTGADDRFIYAHDPLVDAAQPSTDLDRINMPIARKTFEHMARYGKALLQACVMIRARPRS